MKRVALAFLVCCSSTKSAPTDVVIPKASATAVPAGQPTMQDDHGWLLKSEEQLEPKYVERSLVLDAIRKSADRALVVAEDPIEECSSAGGTHAFFTLVEHRGKKPLKSGVIHYGGHGVTLPSAFKKDEVWIASFEPLRVAESVKNEAFCVPDREINGRAIALLRVGSQEDGRHLLDSLR